MDKATDAVAQAKTTHALAGMVPGAGEVADLANTGWYGLEGGTLNASLSAAAAVPGLGWGATGTK
ncbi:hypothetical protein ABR738_07595 [Streptomyces sp. Edi4]|uniref:hypothetical protein n=1 Tax=Streptomyces sp. Edi4 TaxID=3162527 RepID=UPI003305DEEB